MNSLSLHLPSDAFGFRHVSTSLYRRRQRLPESTKDYQNLPGLICQNPAFTDTPFIAQSFGLAASVLWHRPNAVRLAVECVPADAVVPMRKIKVVTFVGSHPELPF